jgi:hypothetical protein
MWASLARAWPLLALAPAACDGSVAHPASAASGGATGSGAGGEGGQPTSASSSGGAGAVGGASNSGSGGECSTPACEIVAACPGHECGDCVDNDGDGLIDMQSPHCLTPCDGSESGFAGVPVVGNPDACKRDCAFDGDMGSGNDQCGHSLECDPKSPGGADCPADPSVVCPPLLPKCLELCGPLTPNGCDCFGCCELPAHGGEFRLTGDVGYPGCSVSDLSGCAPCTPVAECFNPCEGCERCAGSVELPEGCSEQTCPADQPACGQPCQAACTQGLYCQSGCCVAFPR